MFDTSICCFFFLSSQRPAAGGFLVQITEYIRIVDAGIGVLVVQARYMHDCILSRNSYCYYCIGKI